MKGDMIKIIGPWSTWNSSVYSSKAWKSPSFHN